MDINDNCDIYLYSGNVSDSFKSEALEEYRRYRSDKASLMERIRDNERYYRECYSGYSANLKSQMKCHTSFIFSAIENACAISSENYPSPNIIERDPDGSEAANVLSKLISCELDSEGFKKKYKTHTRNKLKYGTAVYGVFYNDRTGNVDIENIDIEDIYVDMHVSDIQDSRFLFISAAVDNDVLKIQYPQYTDLFTGDADVETLTDNYRLTNRSVVLDCYYKKPDGRMHMMKLCKETILTATEDMPGYEGGLYDHGLYPVVFDVLYPIEHCPFGFGMIDIGKPVQIQIDKLDSAITKNLMCSSQPRYFSKRNNGIDDKEFCDLSKSIVHYDGDGTMSVIQTPNINEYHLRHREYKKDELKELLSNRDFQQGDTSGGVVSGTAISLLQQSGEKRSRSMMDDSYEAYKDVIVMVIELIRQFYSEPRTFRTSDENGMKTFMEFSNELLSKCVEYDPASGYRHEPLYFDIDVIPQKENPLTREGQNNTMLALWQSGLLFPNNYSAAVSVLKNMDFDGKEQLISDMQKVLENQQNTSAPNPVNNIEIAPDNSVGDLYSDSVASPDAHTDPYGLGNSDAYPNDVFGDGGGQNVY